MNMLDLTFVLVTILAFLAFFLYVAGCEHLR